MQSDDIIIIKNENVPHQTRNVREQKSGKVGITFVVGVMPVPLSRELFSSFLHVHAVNEVDSQSE